MISTIEYSDSLFHVSTFSASNSEEDSLNSHWLTTVSELLLSPKINCRSTRLQMFLVNQSCSLQNEKLTGKHLRRSLFLNKVDRVTVWWTVLD